MTKAQKGFLAELAEGDVTEGMVCSDKDRTALALLDAGLVKRKSYSVGSVKPRWLYTITAAGLAAAASL